MARKTEIYTWRLSPAIKAGLEETARSQRRTVAQLLDEIVTERLGVDDRRGRTDQEHDPDLPDLQVLMRKYRDRPMDFADATLVHLAQRESLSTVFTIDHSDFATYRISGRKRFRLLPAASPHYSR